MKRSGIGICAAVAAALVLGALQAVGDESGAGDPDPGAGIVVLDIDGKPIASGAAADDIAGTDFGWLDLADASASVTHVFTVVNMGIRPLTLDVQVTGTGFSLVAPYAAILVQPGEKTTFGVKFAYTATGLRTGTVTLNNNTLGSNPYTLPLRGVVGRSRYVSLDGNDANDGLSWATAKATIPGGIGVAANWDTVWVSNGVYTLSATIALNKGVFIRGATGNPEDVVIDGDGAVRCFHVTVQNATIQDLTITNGFVSGNGGGIWVVQSSFKLKNCVLVDNRATATGGGLDEGSYAGRIIGCLFKENQAANGGGYGGRGVLRNCLFVSNIATTSGGAAQTFAASFYDCQFLTNSAPTRGAVFVDGSYYANVVNCLFQGNRSTGGEAGAIRCYAGWVQNCAFRDNAAVGGGGGLSMLLGSVTDCVFINNTATGDGGGAWVQTVSFYGCHFLTNSAASGGGSFSGHNSNNTVSNCLFVGNQATSTAGAGGGGLRMYTVYLLDSTFISNTSAAVGGGFAHTAYGWMSGCTFINNFAANGGGASIGAYTVYNSLFTGNEATGQGGGTYSSGNNQTLENCTITENKSGGNGGGVRGYNATIRNCIVWGNEGSGATSNLTASSLSVMNSCIGPLQTGDGNIAANPKFLASGQGVGLACVPGDYRLHRKSPCRDAGINQAWMTDAVDLAGSPRIYGDLVDMGAYEYHPLPPTATLMLVR